MVDSRETPAVITVYGEDDSSTPDEGAHRCYCCEESVKTVGVCFYCSNHCKFSRKRSVFETECEKNGKKDPLGMTDSVGVL